MIRYPYASMKIALLSPSGVMYRKSDGVFSRFLRYAPLTLTTLAALIPEEIDADVVIYDEGVEEIPLDLEADLIGITAITGTSVRAYQLARYFRLEKQIPAVLGGVHPTLRPDEAQRHADAVVKGLAFDTWPRLLKDFAAGEMDSLYEQDPDLELSDLPEPRRDLIDRFSYLNNGSIQATYSCPYSCDFCSIVASRPGYMHRPVDEVIEELRTLGKYVVFLDPSPMENRAYAKKLFRRMIPLNKTWGGLSTVTIADDPELLDLAAKSGCSGLLIGFEAIDQDATNAIGKGFNRVRKYEEVIRKVHDHGIAINGTFMFGTDEDDPDVFQRTVDFVHRNHIDLPRYAVYTPFPGTRTFQRLKNENRLLHEDWSLYDGQHVVFEPKQMSVDQLREGLLDAWEQTYGFTSILQRIFGSGVSPFLSLLTNFGYKYYADGLRSYSADEMKRRMEEWEPRIELDRQVEEPTLMTDRRVPNVEGVPQRER